MKTFIARITRKSMPKCAGRAALALLAFALFSGWGGPGRLYAQAVKGTLLGTVTDTTGAVVPGATVTITEINTNLSRSMTTNESGNYVFGNLDRGEYRVEIQATGFKKAVRDKVDVLVNSDTRVDMQVAPGDITETIEVAAGAPLLETDRSDVGRQIETKQLQDMPLAFNRNFQGLVNLVPGATRAFRPHSEFFNPQDSLATQVNGQSRLANNVQVEGIDNNHRTGLLTVLIGLMLVAFPGRQRLEKALARRSGVLAAMNRIRASFGHPPLLPPAD